MWMVSMSDDAKKNFSHHDDDGSMEPPVESRLAQRRRADRSSRKCRRCKGARVVPTGELIEAPFGQGVGEVVRPCDCQTGKKS